MICPHPRLTLNPSTLISDISTRIGKPVDRIWGVLGEERNVGKKQTNVGVRCRNSYDERVPFQYNPGDMWNSDLSVRRYNQYVSVPSCPLWCRFQLFLVCIHHLWSHDSMMLYSSGYFSIQSALFLRFGNDSWLKVAFWSSRFLNCSLFGHR